MSSPLEGSTLFNLLFKGNLIIITYIIFYLKVTLSQLCPSRHPFVVSDLRAHLCNVPGMPWKAKWSAKLSGCPRFQQTPRDPFFPALETSTSCEGITWSVAWQAQPAQDLVRGLTPLPFMWLQSWGCSQLAAREPSVQAAGRALILLGWVHAHSRGHSEGRKAVTTWLQQTPSSQKSHSFMFSVSYASLQKILK